MNAFSHLLFRRAAAAAVLALGASAATAADDTFERTVKPFLGAYCTGCHNAAKEAGGLNLDVYLSEAHARKDRKTWATVQHALAAGEMPPKGKPQPAAAAKEALIGWVEATLTAVNCAAPKDPGRVTLRRLNRAEYNNTVRDLCGVELTPADDFPSDDVGYGFDNIGDVLSLPPILLEKYLAAADKVLDVALPGPQVVPSTKQRFSPHDLRATPPSAKRGRDNDEPRITLTTDGAAAFLQRFHVPAEGEYLLRAKVWGKPAAAVPPQVALRLGDAAGAATPVTAPKEKPTVVEAKVRVPAGDQRFSGGLANPDPKGERALGVVFLEVEGPTGGGLRPIPASTTLLLGPDLNPKDKLAAAERVIGAFARKAYRRPVKADELARLLKLFRLADGQGETFTQAVKLPLKAVLASPNFLFRVEADPTSPDGVKPVNDHELSTRLSYFLWASMPDAELSAVADRGELRKPGVLAAQVKRMLADPKSVALTDNFAGQWLQLRSVAAASPDPDVYKSWDEDLRKAMILETESFFDYVVRADRPVTDFLDADYTFLNDRLASHYGIGGVQGPDIRQVTLKDRRRGGLLSQASILTVTSNPTRTSPVKRGKWVLENILGAPPPPPAPDVPELPPVGQIKGTLRQQFEQHRANVSCAGCHAKLDPMGFALENFDGIGGWRDRDNKLPIDSSGVMPDGSKFNGPAELRQVLLGKADQFRRCLADKLLTYATGRGTEYYDKCALDVIAGRLKAGDDKFSALVLAVVESDPFQKRKGKRSE